MGSRVPWEEVPESIRPILQLHTAPDMNSEEVQELDLRSQAGLQNRWEVLKEEALRAASALPPSDLWWCADCYANSVDHADETPTWADDRAPGYCPICFGQTVIPMDWLDPLIEHPEALGP